MSASQFGLRMDRQGSGLLCSEILALLPEWLGIPEANADYAAVADRSATVVASHDSTDIGFLTLVKHFEFAAEVYVMAVRPQWHRHGVGKLLLERAEQELASQGVEFVQVKTRSSTAPNPGYAKTRAFYLARGFRPLEEFPTLWGEADPALQLIKTLNR